MLIVNINFENTLILLHPFTLDKAALQVSRNVGYFRIRSHDNAEIITPTPNTWNVWDLWHKYIGDTAILNDNIYYHLITLLEFLDVVCYVSISLQFIVAFVFQSTNH